MEEHKRVFIDKDNPSIQRIEERCIGCGACLNTCKEVTGLDKNNPELKDYCLYCGACVTNCPMGALKERFSYKKVLNLIKDSNKHVAISIAPAVRVAVAEELLKTDGVNMANILPSILRSMGFTYVFDVTFGADVTIMEEASELIDRLIHGGTLPMFTSCCPSWVKYVELMHPELKNNISTTRSPIGIMSSLIKSYFKEMNNIEEDIISVVVAPCTSKKWEMESNDTDYCITTRELVMMIKECEIDIDSLKPSSFDNLLDKGSRCGLNFGKSGGVMEASLATLCHFLTGKTPRINEYFLEGTGVREATFKMGDKNVHVAVVDGIKNVEEIIPRLDEFDFIEVMNCKGGCVGGGGQPFVSKMESHAKIDIRTKAIDETLNEINFPFENPSIIELYKSYLISPLSEKSESLLHSSKKIFNKKSQEVPHLL